MYKMDFIEQYTTGVYKDYDRTVITFIADIRYDIRNSTDTIRSFYEAGYCYYFAHMLKDAFQRGHLCLTEPIGHIVWMDENGCAYDINGPYRPEEHDCERLLDIRFLGDLILDFMHIPGKEYQAPQQLHEWAEFMHMKDVYAVTRIWQDMPDEEKPDVETMDALELDITSVVYDYWLRHTQKLQERYWPGRKEHHGE